METRPQAGAGDIHPLRTCSVFNNQSHTLLDASGTILSHPLITADQVPSLLCEEGMRKLRIHNKQAQVLCLPSGPVSRQGTELGGCSSQERTLHCMTLSESTSKVCPPGPSHVSPYSRPCFWSKFGSLDLSPIWTHYGTNRSPVLNTGSGLLNSEFRYFINEPFSRSFPFPYILCPHGSTSFCYLHGCV